MSNEEKTLLAGASRVAMKFPEGFFPHTGFRGRYFTGVMDDLCVRCIAVTEGDEGAVFLSLELGDIGDEWIPQIAAVAGIPQENVFIGATHTHSAPHVSSFWKEDVVDEEQGKAFANLCYQAVEQSVREAMAARVPARMLCGTSSCGINVNRDYHCPAAGADADAAPYIQAPNPEGPSDKTVYILKFEDLEGKVIACLFSYAVHSNVNFYQTWTRSDGMKITGDLAGVAMRYVETNLPEGAVAGFFLEPSADQSPMYLSNHRTFDASGKASWEYYGPEAARLLMDAQGKALGTAVIEGLLHLRETSREETSICSTKLVLELDSKLDGYKKQPQEQETDHSYAAQYKEKMSSDFAYIENGTLQMPLYLMRIRGVNFLGIPAEIVTNAGMRLRAAVTAQLGGFTVVYTQCNGSYSYISDDWGYEERTFEAVASHFMPGTADRMERAATKMARRLQTMLHLTEQESVECKILRDMDKITKLRKQKNSIAGAKVLDVLRDVQPISQQKLADQLGIRLQSLVQTLDHLDKKGYILRQRNEEDRREKLLCITEEGEKALEGNESFSQFSVHLLRALTQKEKADLLDLLEKVRKETIREGYGSATGEKK